MIFKTDYPSSMILPPLHLTVIQTFISVPTIVMEVKETDKRSVLYLEKGLSWTSAVPAEMSLLKVWEQAGVCGADA